VHWYIESTRPEPIAGRQALNAWYELFPDPDGAFRNRLRSENDADHYQSMDELYLHQLLATSVEEVRYEERGVGPDFRLYDHGALIGAVEVASLFIRQDWQNESRTHGSLADQVSRRLPPSAGWFVDFDMVLAERQPSVRKLVSFVESELRRLPPPGPEARALVGDGAGMAKYPSTIYQSEGIEIRVRFTPMRPDAPAMSDPAASIVGMGPVVGGMVNSGSRLQARVAGKAGGRYDIGDAPYLVAVGLHDTFCSEDQVVDGLYGGEAMNIETRQVVRRRDGLFGDGGKNTRVSAVATLSQLQPWQSPPTTLTVWDNPAPRTPWPDHLLPFDRRLVLPPAGGRAIWRTI
jgi:hypothetical protein